MAAPNPYNIGAATVEIYTATTIVARCPQNGQSLRKSAKSEISSHLQIVSAPLCERVNLKENRYILLIQPQGIRACGGQFTTGEAYQIARLTKGWNWALDEKNHPICLQPLEQLLDSIIRQSSRGGEL